MSATTTFPTAPLQRPKTSLYPITNNLLIVENELHAYDQDCTDGAEDGQLERVQERRTQWKTKLDALVKENEALIQQQQKKEQQKEYERPESYRSRRMLCKWRQMTQHHACMKSLKSHYHQPNCLRHRQRQRYLLHQCTEISTSTSTLHQFPIRKLF